MSVTVSEESSTWTMYFQDLRSNTENDDVLETDEEILDYESSSLMSDAASFAVPNRRNFVCGKHGGGSGGRNGRICLKKRKGFVGIDYAGDIDLEDTASSPSSSPKVGDVADELAENISAHKEPRITTQVRTETAGLNRKDDGDLTGLRKKGLCLVPLAMLSDYYYTA